MALGDLDTETIGGLLDRIASSGGESVKVLGVIADVLTDLFAFSGDTGSFTSAVAATTVVLNPNVTANSVILLSPTNASAGTQLQSTETFYISAKSAGVSFTVATADGGSPAGTETWNYVIINPLST